MLLKLASCTAYILNRNKIMAFHVTYFLHLDILYLFFRREEIQLSIVWEAIHEKWSSQQTCQTSSGFHSGYAPYRAPHGRRPCSCSSNCHSIHKCDCNPSSCDACPDLTVSGWDDRSDDNSHTNNQCCQTSLLSQRRIFILKPLFPDHESLPDFWHCTYFSTAFFTAIYSKHPK